MRILHQNSTHPRWSPRGDRFVFDRKNADGYYDVYVSDIAGSVVGSLTEGRRGIGQRNNGNAVFHPSGAYVVFISEVGEHLFDEQPAMGDPGVGLFCNLWATGLSGRFWPLTDIPIKRRLGDGIPAMAVVNPQFSRDGSRLIWTERHDDRGGHLNWGRWRVMAADFVIDAGVPRLRDVRVLFTPDVGNYVTAMDFLDEGRLLLAGNLDGQHEYGMDQYILNVATGRLANLTGTPDLWEEDSSLSSRGGLVYMTNQDSPYLLDFGANWVTQRIEREYYWLDFATGRKERLTYFNDPGAPEYAGYSVIVAASDFSPDGRYLAGILGVDFSQGGQRDVELKIILIEMADEAVAARESPGSPTAAARLSGAARR